MDMEHASIVSLAHKEEKERYAKVTPAFIPHLFEQKSLKKGDLS